MRDLCINDRLYNKHHLIWPLPPITRLQQHTEKTLHNVLNVTIRLTLAIFIKKSLVFISYVSNYASQTKTLFKKLNKKRIHQIDSENQSNELPSWYFQCFLPLKLNYRTWKNSALYIHWLLLFKVLLTAIVSAGAHWKTPL